MLTLARKTQTRKPGGLGALGLKQRVSSRALTQLAFPLMSREHAIEEADEETLLESPALPGTDAAALAAAVGAQQRSRRGGGGGSAAAVESSRGGGTGG